MLKKKFELSNRDFNVVNACSGLRLLCLLQKDLVISLIPQLKGEKRDGSSASDPYVAFRRRTEKMQTRKVNCLQCSLNIDSLIAVF